MIKLSILMIIGQFDSHKIQKTTECLFLFEVRYQPAVQVTLFLLFFPLNIFNFFLWLDLEIIERKYFNIFRRVMLVGIESSRFKTLNHELFHNFFFFSPRRFYSLSNFCVFSIERKKRINQKSIFSNYKKAACW